MANNSGVAAKTEGTGTAQAGKASCRLCGLPVGANGIEQRIGNGTESFCCHGCLQVFLLLSSSAGVLPDDFQESDLYRMCVESGIISRSGPTREEDAGQRSRTDLPPLELAYSVGGMWCPSCSWLIEEVLRRTPGIVKARVAFISDLVTLEYLPHVISPPEIVSRVRRLGYRLGAAEAQGTIEGKRAVLRLGLTAFVTANIMMASLAVNAGFLSGISWKGSGYFSYPLLLAGTFVLVYGGWPIFKRGLAAPRYLSPSMDTLISLGALSAYTYSVVQVIRGEAHVYFDTASMLITLVLFGRYIENRVREKVSGGIGELRRAARGKVRIDKDGKEGWADADTVEAGDRFRAVPGDRIPLDSRVIEGAGLVDRSFLTGESKPQAVGAGDILAGGSAVREGKLLLETERTAAESFVGRIVAAVEEAMDKKNEYELFAERASRLFVPAILLLTVATALLTWHHHSGDVTLMRSLTVLLISCPCALGLAIPLAKVAVMDLARRRGILVKNPGALERLREVDTIVFDKTGTLSEGDFSLQRVECPELDERRLFERLAAIESQASHFLAREIVREAKKRALDIEKAECFVASPGLGVRGRVQDMEILIGNRKFMEQNRLEMGQDFGDGAGRLGRDGKTVVFFGWNGRVRGFLAFGDPLRQGAKELVDSLTARALDLWIISGDDESTTRAIAHSLGIGNVVAGALPDDKVSLIKDLKKQGRKVAMVGDGMNDAGALAEADTSLAFGAGMDQIREAADISFLSSEPLRLLDALDLSALAARTIRQNLLFAFLYNVIAIPLAALGLLNPLIAVVAMFASSLTVTLNTLRVARMGKGSDHRGDPQSDAPIVSSAW